MLAKDRLHVVSLILTALAAMFQFIGVLLPNWWILKNHMRDTITTFNLFGHISCNDTVCYPADLNIVPVPPGMDPPSGISGDNAAWLTVGRLFSIVGLVSVAVTVVLQLVFLLKMNSRSLQVIAVCFLVTAAVITFVTGFLFIGKFFTLTDVYVSKRPLGALTYTPAAPGCFLFASLLCTVAAVFTTLAFRAPIKDTRFL